jgi:hypothetical protein
MEYTIICSLMSLKYIFCMMQYVYVKKTNKFQKSIL